ncbi:MAG: hypothetical protein R6W71_07485 [Bacteroidales bacterium]
MESLITIIAGFVGFLAFLVFFVMAFYVESMHKNIKKIYQILDAWEKSKNE